MKKLNFSAFTLVEMLIVIVIIGILIAALLPRLQGAQNMARDTARQTALSQLQSAIVAYQSQAGKWPELVSAKGGTGTAGLKVLIDDGIMSSIPADPNLSNEVSGMGGKTVSGQFLYLVAVKNSITDGWFVLMARTETPWRSNWVVDSSVGQLTGGTDLAKIVPCKTITMDSAGTTTSLTWWPDGGCLAAGPANLRYILIY